MALATNHLVPENVFREYVRIVSKIALQHEEVLKSVGNYQLPGHFKPEKNKNNLEFSSGYDGIDDAVGKWGVSGKEKGNVGDVDSSGDTFMGGINAANLVIGPNGKPLRSKWKTPEQIQKLRNEGKCFRCERKGCSTRKCKLLPALRKERGPTVNLADFSELYPAVYEEDEDISGKAQLLSKVAFRGK